MKNLNRGGGYTTFNELLYTLEVDRNNPSKATVTMIESGVNNDEIIIPIIARSLDEGDISISINDTANAWIMEGSYYIARSAASAAFNLSITGPKSANDTWSIERMALIEDRVGAFGVYGPIVAYEFSLDDGYVWDMDKINGNGGIRAMIGGGFYGAFVLNRYNRNMVRRDGNGPDNSVIVIVLFNHTCKGPVHADPVAAHDGHMALSVHIKEAYIHRLCILCAKFKNMPKFVSLFFIKFRAA